MRFVSRLTIKSKLILTLVFVSVASVAGVGYIAIRNGQDTIVEAVFDHLTSVRASKASQIESYFRRQRDYVITLAEGQMMVQAMDEFAARFDELAGVPVQPSWSTQLEAYYRTEMIPRLAENLVGTPVLEQYLPRDPQVLYLQHHYIAANPHPVGQKAKLDRGDDDSAYGAAHARYHPLFRNILERFGFHDIFLIDARSRAVVYSVSKETDFAMGLDAGPYGDSGLARVVKTALGSPDRGFVTMVDFAAYRPSYAAPAAFIASPVFKDQRVIGVLALQLSVDRINAVMTGQRQWEADGLGKTGETYLVGHDRLMRSMSRFLIEEPKRYFSDLREAGVDGARIERIRRLGTSILQQEVRTEAVAEAHAGHSGTKQILDYRGAPVLSSYAPLAIDDANWVILSEMDLAEAFAPMRRFARYTFISIAVVVFLVTIVAMLLSEAFAAPIRALIRDVRRIGDGEATRVATDYSDEFGELAKRFNETVTALEVRTVETGQENRRYDRLLLKLLPRTVIARLLKGDETVAERHPNVTVLFGDIVGLSALADSMTPTDYVQMLNKLVGAFDDATQRHGVEKFKTAGCNYMAVSGLSVVRLDHARCVMDFAIEMFAVLRRFNRDWATGLSLRVGISSGPVVSAIVGRDRLAYDLTGKAMRVASLLSMRAEANTIRVSDEVRENLSRLHQFTDCGSAELSDDTPMRMWSLDPYAASEPPAAEAEL